MGYVLLWVLALGACLSWLAAALATPARVSNLFSRIFLRLLLAWPAVGAVGCGFAFAVVLREEGDIHAGDAWLIYIVLGLFVPAAVGMLWMRWWRRPADPAVVEAKSVRRRTVGALYMLALLCAALHGLTAYVLRNATVGGILAARDAAAPAVQAYLDADRAKYEPILATRAADQPRDFTAAYQDYNAPPPVGGGLDRHHALESWSVSWQVALYQEGRPSSDRIPIADGVKTYTPEDQLQLTLAEMLARYQPEIEEIRQLATVRPYKAEFTLARLTTFAEEDPGFAIQGLVQVLQLNAVGALEAGDANRAARDLAAIIQLAELVIEKGGFGLMFNAVCHGIGQSAAETYLSTPGLTAEELRALPIGGDSTLQSRMKRCLVEELYIDLSSRAEAAADSNSWMTLAPGRYRMRGYFGWMFVSHAAPTGVEDRVRTATVWNPLVEPPYLETRARWAEEFTYTELGREGIYQRSMVAVYLGMVVRVDMRGDLLRVGRAAMLYKLEHGRFPAALTALTPDFLPALPVDAFTGEALHFRLEDDGQGLVIWSVGDDGVDDGATLAKEAEHDEEDITLFLGTAYDRARAYAQQEQQKRSAGN